MQSQTENFAPKTSLSIAQTLIVTVIAVISALVSVGIYQGSLSQRVTALEESKQEVAKKLERIEDKMVDRERYANDQSGNERILGEIKADVKELRQIMMRK